MIFNLSFRNFKKSFKDYSIYFFTLITGVTVFYLFNCIESQTAMLELSESQKDIAKLFGNSMTAVSVFVAVVLGFLIIYASRFLMKRRKQEFGIYLMLGMGKGKLSLLLFFETVLVGFVSLAMGLIIGICLSQLTSIFVSRIFVADMTKFQFTFSKNAFIKTVLCFALVYVIVIVFNTVSINSTSLIKLFQAKRKSERVHLKNIYLCLAFIAVAVCCLGYAYYKVGGGYEKISNEKELFFLIGLGVVGTFLFFGGISGVFIKFVTHFKGYYYKGLNCFTLRQISSKINTMIISMSIICLMLFVTICIMISGLTIRNSTVYTFEELVPVDLQLYHEIYDDSYINEDRYLYTKDKVETSRKTAEELYKTAGYDLSEKVKEKAYCYIYNMNYYTFKAFCGSEYETVNEKYNFLTYDNPESVVKLSDYNRIAKLYGNETYTLNSDEYMVIGNYGTGLKIRNQVLSKGIEQNINGRTLKPKYKECKNGFIFLSGSKSEDGITVVSDDVLSGVNPVEEVFSANIKGNPEEKKSVENMLQTANKQINKKEDIDIIISGKNDMKESTMGLGALFAFIAIYISIIFLLTSSAILALKELSESADNIERYKMLKKLGVDDRLINGSVFKQIALFFMLPLLFACVHCVPGMLFSKSILEVFGTNYIFISTGITAAIVAVIYGGYLAVTYFTSRNMIK